jgi:hypothetical protein
MAMLTGYILGMSFHLWWLVVLLIESLWRVIPVAVAALAAYFSYRSARATRLAAQGHLFYELLRRYSSEEMLKALNVVAEFRKAQERDKAKFLQAVSMYKAGDRIEVDWKVKKGEGEYSERLVNQTWEEVNQARRQISHFFITALELYENNQALGRTFFSNICSFDGFVLLYSVVEWLELAHNPNHNRDKFTNLLYQCGRAKDEVEQLDRLRPPRTWAEVERMMQADQHGAKRDERG